MALGSNPPSKRAQATDRRGALAEHLCVGVPDGASRLDEQDGEFWAVLLGRLVLCRTDKPVEQPAVGQVVWEQDDLGTMLAGVIDHRVHSARARQPAAGTDAKAVRLGDLLRQRRVAKHL